MSLLPRRATVVAIALVVGLTAGCVNGQLTVTDPAQVAAVPGAPPLTRCGSTTSP